MVHGNHFFIREDRQETLTCIHFQRETSRNYDVMVGGVTHKSLYLREAESFAFYQQLA